LSKNWIDTHFHVFTAGVAVAGARYAPRYDAPLAEWLRQAQGAGVGRGVCVQPSFLGTDNRLLVEVLRAQPERLRGVAVVAPDVSDDELQALHQAGVRGIRLNLAGVSHDVPQWTRAVGVWDFIHSNGWHLEVHTDAGRLPRVLDQLPTDITLVVDHMAKPLQAKAQDASLVALKRRARTSQVSVKLSGAYRLGGVDPARLAALLHHELGADALLWGSDWPCTNHEECADFGQLVAQAQQWIAPECIEQVLVRNPMRLYWALNPINASAATLT
jgi:predicted TIM-barrel fold metal-dependent hydrolase